MSRRLAMLISFLSFSASPVWAASGNDPVLQALFSSDEEEILIDRLPFETEAVSLGLFKLSDKELDRVERPDLISSYLASFSGESSFHSGRVFEKSAELTPGSVQKKSDELVIMLTSDAQEALLPACELIAQHPGKPVIIDVFSADIISGQEREKRVVEFVSSVLARHPDEIETIIQIDPEGTDVLRIHILGAGQ